MATAKPFIKWVGGKTQLLSQIQSFIPQNVANITNLTYVEPFVGGGSMLFYMLEKFPNITTAVINDINPKLTNLYQIIKQTPAQLIEKLAEFDNNYLKLDIQAQEEFFYTNRQKFNSDNNTPLDEAALFIFLNKTCFNGLYRVNKSGAFNVPFGKYKKPLICDSSTILRDSELLQKVTILTGDFAQTLSYASSNTLFYLDPPYKPISQTASFTSYSADQFSDNEQIRLKQFCDQISQQQAYILISNSDPSQTDPANNFFSKLYSKYHIHKVKASRAINCQADKRGKLSELLILNYNNIITQQTLF